MATGDANDIRTRLRALLPNGWFPQTAPVLDALLAGLAQGKAYVYQLLAYAKAQMRIRTASDGFLDLMAQDYLGDALPRRQGEQDDAYRQRILANLITDRGTRAAMIRIIGSLTGYYPEIFEPQRPADTGGYGVAMGWNVAGRWGDMQLPAQCFIKVYRPAGFGIASIAGWNTGAGGWGVGRIKYANLKEIQGIVTDADIYAAINAAKVAGTTCWVNIQNHSDSTRPYP